MEMMNWRVMYEESWETSNTSRVYWWKAIFVVFSVVASVWWKFTEKSLIFDTSHYAIRTKSLIGCMSVLELPVLATVVGWMVQSGDKFGGGPKTLPVHSLFLYPSYQGRKLINCCFSIMFLISDLNFFGCAASRLNYLAALDVSPQFTNTLTGSR